MARISRVFGALALLVASIPATSAQSQPPNGPGAGVGPDRPLILLAQKGVVKKKAGAEKKAIPAAEETAKTAAGSDATSATAKDKDTGLKFSRDIAPIFVGNCIGCHNPERRRGKFDLTTFEKLMAGSDVEKVIAPGNPDESHLVLRLRGEETPKMPQGNNNNLSEEAIAKVEAWVKAGARLDAGIAPKALLTSYAPTVEQLRAAELKKLPAEERDKMVEAVAMKRWKQASPKNTPEVTSSEHFLLFSTLPKDRAVAASKGIETAYAQLRNILAKPGAPPALDWAEKTSLMIFNDAASFVEFVRTQENREIEPSEIGTANFGTKEPYLAVIDPHGGRDEPSSARKPSRARRGDDESASGERSVTGLLADQLAMGVLKDEKNTPSWLCLGLGAYFATALDPHSGDVRKLRGTAASLVQQGWTSRANDALGGQLKTEDTRAVGYAIVDWMMQNPQTKRLFPAFVRGIVAEGGTKLDDVLQGVYGARRQDLLYSSGQWAERYGMKR